MDFLLTRTFLEVVTSGSFVAASKCLNVTQGAVSLRIQTLERNIGRTLFVRNKNGAALTPAGEKFHRYATTLAQVWQQAHYLLAVPEGYRTVIHVGGQLSLWDQLIRKWLRVMRKEASDVFVHIEVDLPEALINRLVTGILDLGVMYTPQLRPGLQVVKLFDEELIHVTAAKPERETNDKQFVLVDWGPGFPMPPQTSAQDRSGPTMSFGQGSLGLDYVLDNGGSIYLPTRVAEPYIKSSQLILAKDAPTYAYPAYVVYSDMGDMEAMENAIEALRAVSKTT